MELHSQKTADFTNGNITRMLLTFALPFFLNSLIQSLYNIVDIIVIGRYCGTAGIAGASIGGSLTMTLTYMVIGLCSGGSIMAAQYLGMKSEKDVQETVTTTITLMVLLSVVVMGVMFLFQYPVLRLMNTPEEAFSSTVTYLRICLCGCLFIFGYNTLSSLLHGLGDSRTPMIFGILSCVINIILDLLFTGVLGLDVAGAAAATVIAQAAACIFCFIYLRRTNPYFSFGIRELKLNREKAVTVLRLGFPSAIQNTIVSGGFLIVSSITNSIGYMASSAVAVAQKVNNVCQMPAVAFGSASSAMIGQNVGAKRLDRAEAVMKESMKICFAIGIVMLGLVWLSPRTFLQLLTEDVELIETAVPYLLMTSFDYILVAFCFPLNSLCNGSGHTMFTMLPSIASSVVVRVPVAYFCVRVFDLGLLGIGISTPTGTLSAILLCAWFYRSGRWKKPVLKKTT